MKKLLLVCALALPFLPLHAQAPDPDESMGDHAERAATTPVRDLNIKSDEIPPKLLEVRDDPYALDAGWRCRQIIDEVVELNAVLGPDYGVEVEKSKAEKREEAAGRISGGIIGGLIPFRGLVREITGASKKDREIQAAYVAGAVRRGFLKGVGLRRGCKAPARP